MAQPIDGSLVPVWSGSPLILPSSPTMIIAGDSRVERGNFIVASSTISRSGTAATVTATSHNCGVGETISLSRNGCEGPCDVCSVR